MGSERHFCSTKIRAKLIRHRLPIISVIHATNFLLVEEEDNTEDKIFSLLLIVKIEDGMALKHQQRYSRKRP